MFVIKKKFTNFGIFRETEKERVNQMCRELQYEVYSILFKCTLYSILFKLQRKRDSGRDLQRKEIGRERAGETYKVNQNVWKIWVEYHVYKSLWVNVRHNLYNLQVIGVILLSNNFATSAL